MNKKEILKKKADLKRYKKAWYAANRDKMRAYRKKYREKNIDSISQRDDKRRFYEAKYRESNREKLNEYHRNYVKNRKISDPAFRSIYSARNRLRTFMKKRYRYSKSLGCSFEDFKRHIEAQFQVGMTWENYGKWHIDHIYPLSVAYKDGPEAFAKACNYTNLQPLWAKDNLMKGNKTIL